MRLLTSKGMIMPQEFHWNQPYILSESADYQIVQEQCLFYKKEGQKIYLGMMKETAEKEEQPAKWYEFLSESEVEEIIFLPAFQDKPLLVELEKPFRLLSGSQSRFTLQVLPLISVFVRRQEQDLLLWQFSGNDLKPTWFGSKIEGEHCYWYQCSRQTDVDIGTVICPIEVENQQSEPAWIQYIRIDVPSMDIFLDNDRLFTQTTRLQIKTGLHNTSHFETIKTTDYDDSQRVSVAKITQKKWFMPSSYTKF